MFPVSAEHTLDECKHFVASVSLPGPVDIAGESMEAFYQRHGQVLLPTLCDGDCGIDVMLQMIGDSNLVDNRNNLREELRDYLMERMEVGWMIQLMSACCEVPAAEVAALGINLGAVPAVARVQEQFMPRNCGSRDALPTIETISNGDEAPPGEADALHTDSEIRRADPQSRVTDPPCRPPVAGDSTTGSCRRPAVAGDSRSGSQGFASQWRESQSQSWSA